MINKLAQNVSVIELKELLDFYIKNDGLSLFIWGNPGVGKTTIIEEYCKNHNILFENFKLSQENPVTVVGLYGLDHNSKTTERYFNERIAKVIENDKQGNISVIFLDELIQGTNTIPAIWELVNERRLGKYQFKNLRIIAASNFIEDYVIALDNAFYSRFIHVNLEPTVEEVTNYIANNCKGLEVPIFLRANSHCLYEDKSITHVINPRKWYRIQQHIDKDKNHFRKFARAYHLYAMQLAEMLDELDKLKSFDELVNEPGFKTLKQIMKSNDVKDKFMQYYFILNFNAKNITREPVKFTNIIYALKREFGEKHSLIKMIDYQLKYFKDEINNLATISSAKDILKLLEQTI